MEARAAEQVRKSRAYPRRLRAEVCAFLRELVNEIPPQERDEMGVPSYLHRNPAMRWLYWRRLDVALRLAGSDLGTVLDFGCGPGMLLPLLAARANRVLAVDDHLEVARRLADRFACPNVSLAPSESVAAMPPASADLILALDVLEHVPDLPATVAQLCRILVPGGRLLVSGSTENLLYRCGRRLAGFSGCYHRRSVYTVLEAIRPHLQISRSVTLPRACPLFILAACTKHPAACAQETSPSPGKPA